MKSVLSMSVAESSSSEVRLVNLSYNKREESNSEHPTGRMPSLLFPIGDVLSAGCSRKVFTIQGFGNERAD